MPTYKLTYFSLPGFGEPIRFLLSYLGGDFEDFRIKQEDWPTIKPTTPFGKVPVLEIDGKKVHQSTAICRYLGKQANLAGKNDWEALQIDIAVDTFHDVRQAIANYLYEQNEEAKAKKLSTLQNETLPFYFGKFDEIVKENNGYLANGELSWGDLFFVAVLDFLKKYIDFDCFEKYQNLRQLRENVLSLPQIQEWIKKRPQTD